MNKSEKILLVVTFFVTAFAQNSFAQDSATTSQSPQILSLYYNIKDALVAENANTAASNAEAFVKAVNGIDYKLISEGNINTLVKDGTAISQTKDLKEQRMHFANLSTNMLAVAKAVKLTDQPVYEAFCPMKKAYWLSSDKTIKNPYFGTAMLTCGKVVETLNQ
ncbi:MAG: DUF3347 domain-containing protein [Segetibacter sp.]